MAAAAVMDTDYLRSLGMPLIFETEGVQKSPCGISPVRAKAGDPAKVAKTAEVPAAAAGQTAGAQASVSSAAPPHAGQAPPGGTVTEHVFWTDTSLVELESCLLIAVTKTATDSTDTVKLTIVLSRTIFHPQGGGQPADTGTLNAEGLPELCVSFTSCRKEDGAILHDCKVAPAVADAWCNAPSGVKVSCHVDPEKRKLCARLHSAGHLLDAAVSAIRPPLKWVPDKGFHFPDGPYVEYVLADDSRKLDPKEKDAVLTDIQANMDRLVASGGCVNIQYKNGLRHIEMAGEVCPCGGTHVAKLSEIGGIKVKKMQNKQGNVRLSYCCLCSAA
jgi:Ser-tRNA(Ala) deacylase AlaX